ncbi:hypothetical protein ABER68_04185 [Paenibacillus alvei]
MKDILIRDKSGERIHVGKVIREINEDFTKKSPDSRIVPLEGKTGLCKMTATATAAGSVNISQRNNVYGGQTYTYRASVKGRPEGSTAYLECSFRDANGTEIGTRQTKELTLTRAVQTIELLNVKIPDAAVTSDIIIGLKLGTAGGSVTFFVYEAAVTHDMSGVNILKNSKFDLNNVNGSLENWTLYRGSGVSGVTEASNVYIAPNFETGYGYATFTGQRYNDVQGGVKVDLNFKPSNFREINWTAEGVCFIANKKVSPILAIRNEAGTAGLFITHGYTNDVADTTAKLGIYNSDGTIKTRAIPYNLILDYERLRRRNLTITMYPQSKMIYILEGDQVIYFGEHPELVTDQSVKAMLYLDNLDTTAQSIAVSKVNLQLIHN